MQGKNVLSTYGLGFAWSTRLENAGIKHKNSTSPNGQLGKPSPTLKASLKKKKKKKKKTLWFWAMIGIWKFAQPVHLSN